MQPQPTPSLNSVPQLPLNAVTTEQIQKCLDDNKNLILAILENQNLGKLAECAQYQAILQKNLMYLAAIADAQQPQGSANSSQQAPSSVPQQGNPMQQTQATALPQQQVAVPKLPFQLNGGFPSQEQQQQLLQFQQQQQQQQQFQGHPGFGATVNNGMHQLMRPGLSGASGLDMRGNKQVGLEANSSDGLGKLAPGQGGGGGGRE
ncbi:PREDICTED: GRF1-interacting factor 2-like isoform X2 [Ipomoea nil]|uniref:GRF1-interacting factor 2-like isoform X2 n=1 Tax=Ipomoea nil TaxID=35883 RepID=UPI0009011D8E|nr:PREDICTED: GRF1-interacting factor 2-like isoform X2 [Ipomoea nil]